MGARLSRRGTVVIVLGVCVLVLFLGFGTLNAFNPKSAKPVSPTQTIVFAALSALAFLLFLAVLVLLVRNVLRLYMDQRSRVLGTRLRTRMLGGAVLVSVVPLVFMFAFSYLLMNRAVDRWFSQPVSQMRDDANRISDAMLRYTAANSRAEADSIALDLAQSRSRAPLAKPALMAELNGHLVTLQGGFAAILRDNTPMASLRVPAALTATTVQRYDGLPVMLNGTEYVLAVSPAADGRSVVVGMPVPEGVGQATANLHRDSDHYWLLFRQRRQVRLLYSLLLALITVLALFASCWLALNLSKQVTRPIELLADAMEAIAAGAYERRVQQGSTEELGELADSFNTMAAELESSRALATRSTADLFDANASLEAQRAELETIIETIPNGVATLNAAGEVVLANRAFCELLDPNGQRAFAGAALVSLFPVDATEMLRHILRRSHRMGAAATELDLPRKGRGDKRHVALTAALLERRTGMATDHVGYVLVLEDLSELVRAQRESAWKEAARRVAHEIKNPLTPISLNAEQITRHVRRLTPVINEHAIESPSLSVIAHSAEVITASVGTMRTLVDQFGALAEFPSARPRPTEMNTVARAALALFTGRDTGVELRLSLADELPLVVADPESLKRALSNVIDNALEAMESTLLRELSVSSRLLPSGLVELVIADTGTGLTSEMRERLFLPYFSTKQRGTGLGLSIAAKIAADFGGTLRAEDHQPTGASFIFELLTAAQSESDETLPSFAAAPGSQQGASA